MSLLPATRRAEEFAALLESGRRTDDPVAAPLTALASALQTVPRVPAPRAEFRGALRQRLVAVAAVQPTEPVASPVARLREARIPWRAQRRIVAIAAGAAVVTAVAGVGISASRSLPGDPFYGIKRAAEDVQLAAAESKEAKGKRHLEFARTRLAEVRALAEQTSALGPMSPAVPGAAASRASTSTLLSTLQDMDSETRAGATDLWAVFRSSGSTEPLRALDAFTRKQYADLRATLPLLPIAVQNRAKSSLELLRLVATETVAEATSGAGTGTSGGGVPGSQPGTATTGPTPTLTPNPGGTGGTGGTGSTSGSSPTSGTPVLPTSPPPATGPLPTTIPTLPTSPLPTLPGTSPSPSSTTLIGPLPSLSTSSLLPSTSTSSLLPTLSTSSLLPTGSTSSLLPGLG